MASLRRDLGRDVNEQIAHDTHRQANRRWRPVEVISSLLTPHLVPLVLYRMSHVLYVKGWKRAAWALWWCNALLHKVSISPPSCIGGGLFLPHPVGIHFHGRAGRRLTLYSNAVCAGEDAGTGDDPDRAPRLGDGVVVGVNASVLGAVSVGSGSSIAFNTCLEQDVQPDAVAVSRALRVTILPPEPRT